MAEQQTASQPRAGATFPSNWLIAPDFDPNDHLMNLKGRDYLNVQNRLLWFIRDQRSFINLGLAQMPYSIESELVEMDREVGWAHYKTRVRDVLGNEATMYGSESAKDFPDFAEKASTKSLGRALLALGYGTAFAPEMDEGDRVVDSPVARRRTDLRPQQQAPAQQPMHAAIAQQPVSTPTTDAPASEQQMVSIRKLCGALDKQEPDGALSYTQARQIITQLSGEYQRMRRAS